MSALPPRFLSDALNRIRPSATIAVTQKARELKAAGRGDHRPGGPASRTVRRRQHQGSGDPRHPAPARPNTSRWKAFPELRAAIAAKFKRENGLDYTVAQTFVAPGGKAVVYNALHGDAEPGDEVVIPAPYWVSYPDIVLLGGGTPVIVPTLAERLPPDARAAGETITPKTKWFLLNAPSRTVGRLLHQGRPEGAGRGAAAPPHVWVLTDDMYEHLVYDGFKFWTIARVEPRLYERTLTMNGVSKAYAMTGWRIGYAYLSR